MTDFERKVLNRIEKLIVQGKLGDAFHIANLKQSADYSNLKRIKSYSKYHKISVPGIMKCRNPFQLADYWVITDPN